LMIQAVLAYALIPAILLFLVMTYVARKIALIPPQVSLILWVLNF